MLRTSIILAVVILSPVLLFGESLDLDSSHQIFHFHGTDGESWIGGYLKGLGDINNDGFDDIAFSSSVPRGIYIFLGGNPPDSFPDYFLDTVMRIGDFLDYNGDGNPDLVASSDSALYLYQVVDDSLDINPIDSFHIPAGHVEFRLMATEDINGDSVADILMRAKDPYEGHRIYLYYNPFYSDSLIDWLYAISSYSHSTYTAGFIDFNGDSTLDIFISKLARLDTLSYIDVYTGPLFGTTPNYIIGHPAEFDSLEKEWFADEAYNIGDINGDNWDDLGVTSYYAGAHSLVYLCGQDVDTVYDYWLDGKSRVMARGGDINADGFNDLIIGGADSYRGRVIVYLGGIGFDTVRDDYIIQGDLPPLFLDLIGWRLSSAGDFNGDNYDDILFMCRNFAGGNPCDVFIFAGGNDITVDVKEESKALIPKKLKLHQNHPNPFNLRTEISFEIPRRSQVTVTVYNILGRKVVVLVNEELEAGSYMVNWDGRDDKGKITPSGVYFYRLQAGGFSDTKKMIILK